MNAYQIQKEVPVKKNNFLLELLIAPPSTGNAHNPTPQPVSSSPHTDLDPSPHQQMRALFNNLKSELAESASQAMAKAPARQTSPAPQENASSPVQEPVITSFSALKGISTGTQPPPANPDSPDRTPQASTSQSWLKNILRSSSKA